MILYCKFFWTNYGSCRHASPWMNCRIVGSARTIFFTVALRPQRPSGFIRDGEPRAVTSISYSSCALTRTKDCKCIASLCSNQRHSPLWYLCLNWAARLLVPETITTITEGLVTPFLPRRYLFSSKGWETRS